MSIHPPNSNIYASFGKHLRQFLLGLSLVTLVAGLPSSHALREAPAEGQEGGGGGQAEYNTIIKERDEAREQAGERWKQMAEPAADASVVIKIRGKVSEDHPRGIIIQEDRLSQNEFDQDNPSALYHHVKNNHNPQYAESEPSKIQGERQHVSKTQRALKSGKTWNWWFLGFLALAAGGWWIRRG